MELIETHRVRATGTRTIATMGSVHRANTVVGRRTNRAAVNTRRSFVGRVKRRGTWPIFAVTKIRNRQILLIATLPKLINKLILIIFSRQDACGAPARTEMNSGIFSIRDTKKSGRAWPLMTSHLKRLNAIPVHRVR